MLKRKMHGCTSKTCTTLRKLYFHLSNMADLYVAAKKRGGWCVREREKNGEWSKILWLVDFKRQVGGHKKDISGRN